MEPKERWLDARRLWQHGCPLSPKGTQLIHSNRVACGMLGCSDAGNKSERNEHAFSSPRRLGWLLCLLIPDLGAISALHCTSHLRAIIFLLPIQWLLKPRAPQSQANNGRPARKWWKWAGWVGEGSVFCGQIWVTNSGPSAVCNWNGSGQELLLVIPFRLNGFR